MIKDKETAIEVMKKYNASMDYAPVAGGVIILTEHNKYEDVNTSIFLEMKNEGIIELENTLYNWHPVFRPSFMNPIQEWKLK